MDGSDAVPEPPPNEPRAGWTEPAWLRAAVPLLAVLLAFLLRWGPHVALDDADGTWIADPDACFHMRRVFLLLARGTLPERDQWAGHPEGAVPYVAPLLDWIVYGACRIAGLGADDEMAVNRVGAFVPAVLGALVVLPVWGIARRLFGPTTGAVAAFVLAVLPGHILYTRYGMVDHHGLESLFLSCLVWATSGKGRWRPALLGALCLLGLALAWNGFALYVIMFAGVSALAPWRAPDAAAARMPALGARTLLAFLPLLAVFVVAPGWWFRHGEVRYDAPSLFHLVLVGACAAWCEVAARLYRMPRIAGAVEDGPLGYIDARPWRRAAAVLAAGAAIGGVLLVVPGPIHDAFVAMFLFPKISVNRFNLEGRPVWQYTQWIFDHLSGLIFLLPLALYCVCALGEEDGRESEPLWNVSGWALAGFILTVWMTRFTYVYAPLLAIVIAALAWAAARAAGGFRLLAHPGARAASGAVVVFACLLPVIDSIRSVAEGAWENPSRRARTLRSLRTLTPEPGDWRRPEEQASWGVLGPWGYGHAIKFWARRPVVSDNMGLGFENEFRFALALDEEEAVAVLRELRVGCVIAQHDSHLVEGYAEAFGKADRPTFARRNDQGEWQATEDYWRRVQIRLMSSDGAAGLEDDGLSHFRLIAACPEAGKEGTGPYEFKCFAVVAGARLTGRAEPGARVSARSEQRAPDGRSFPYVRRGKADAAGRWEIVVAYPGSYQITIGMHPGEATVSDEAVRDGSEVPVE